METAKIRIGKDFTVLWRIYKRLNGVKTEYPLDAGKENYILRLWTPYGKKDITMFEIEGNTITFKFLGKDQKHVGNYSLELIERKDAIGMMTVDTAGFTLVAFSRMETAGADGDIVIQDVQLEGELALSPMVSLTIDTELSDTSVNALSNYVITREINDIHRSLGEKVDSTSLATINGKRVDTGGNIEIEGTKVDSQLSKTSANPVQNKVITSVLSEQGEKLATIETGAQKNVAPDWNASTYKAGHIKNRTHHMQDFMCIELTGSPVRISKPSNVGYVLLAYDTDLADKFIRIEIKADEYKTYEFLDAMGLPITFTWDNGSSTINVQTFGGALESYSMRAYYSSSAKGFDDYFIALDEGFIPKEVLRKTDIATINGQRLTEGGNIVIDGKNYDDEIAARNVGAVDVEGGAEAPDAPSGGGYDDTEIREELAQLSERIDDIGEGAVGPQGPQGEQGPAGPEGPQGPKGDQGNSGYTGAAGELEIVNNLTQGGATAALSAEMGKVLSAETRENSETLAAIVVKTEPSVNLFEPSIKGMFYSQYGAELVGETYFCQVVEVSEGDVLRFYVWNGTAYVAQKANVFTAYSNGVCIAAKGVSKVAEFVVPSEINEVRVGLSTQYNTSKFCLTKNIADAPTTQVFYEESKTLIKTDPTLTLKGVPADAYAVRVLVGKRIDLASGVDYQQNQGSINKLGILKADDANFWYSTPIAVKRGEVVYMTTPYQGNGMAIGRTDADGNYYAPIAIHDNTKSYVAYIDFDGYIAITFIKDYLPTEFYKETSQFAIDKGIAETYADLEVAKKESAEIDYKALEVQHETHFTNLCIQARFERGKMVAELATLTDDDILAQGSCGYTESNGQITDGTIQWRIYKGGLLHISGYGKMYDFIKGTEAAKSEEEVHQKVRDLGAEFWYYGFVNENVNGIVPPFPQSNQKYETDEVMNYSNKRYVPFGEDINPLNGKPYGYSAPWYIYRVHVDDAYTSYDLYKAKNPHGITYNRILIEEDASKGGITYIGNWAFYRVSADSLILPSSVTKIGCWGVRYSPVLKTLIMGDNITTIEDHGVSRMEAMEAVKISNKLVSLGYSGMDSDAQLKMVDFPNTTTSLGTFCFNGCGSLQLAKFGSVASMPRNFATLSSLVKADIPSATKVIGMNAFYKTDINRLIIPSNVSNIESDAFRYVDIKAIVIESQSILDKMTIQNAPETTQLQQGACIGRCDYILIPIGLTPSYAIEQLFLYKGEDENYRYYKRNTPKIALGS